MVPCQLTVRGIVVTTDSVQGNSQQIVLSCITCLASGNIKEMGQKKPKGQKWDNLEQNWYFDLTRVVIINTKVSTATA